MPFATVLSGACFLVSSFYLIRDREAVKAIVNGQTDENRTLLDHGDCDDESISHDRASNDIPNGDVKSNDVTNNDVISNDVSPDNDDDHIHKDVNIDDNMSQNEVPEELRYGVQCHSPRDSISDDEVTQHLINV